ncbi:LLM class flavin-dependent oxidoreductase [Hyphococcus sp.]|uniref:LLM class flavin-dependent oxidoreductase n=1 Tax=Hyphococcus sp. TaxID=2038636 RepID=UPI0037513418
MIPISLLDLCPIIEGGDAAQALHNARDLAQLGESLGYRRIWLAEHHNIPGVASAATSVVIGYVAEGTNSIRVGAGGIMLPNHPPLVIAEQFGTLASLYPGRIDLGLGRAPGGDMNSIRALRRPMRENGEDRFPYDVRELQFFLGPAEEGKLQAVPGAGTHVPIWILGSSLYGAQLAAEFGLPYAFASHFAPAELERAIHVYRTSFRPSEQLTKPYLMLASNVIAADSDDEAQLLATSLYQAFVNLRTGRPGKLPPPVAGYLESLDPMAQSMLRQTLSCSFVGGPETVKREMQTFIDRHRPDEMMFAGQVFDHGARRRSFEIAAECASQLSLA